MNARFLERWDDRAIRPARRLLLGGAAIIAAVAAAPASACQPVTVYFAWNSAAIEQESLEALEELAVTLAWRGPDLAAVALSSHTDASGSPAANRALALRRARAVRDVLVAYQVPAEVIRIEALGPAAPRVWTPRNAREPANRRVELLVQLSASAQAQQLSEQQPIC